MQLLAHRPQRSALMLTPRKHPGEFVSPRILPPRPACFILVTKRAADFWESAASSNIFLASGFFCSQTESTPAHTQVTQTVGHEITTVEGLASDNDNLSQLQQSLCLTWQFLPPGYQHIVDAVKLAREKMETIEKVNAGEVFTCRN